jgi:hypothetical protein
MNYEDLELRADEDEEPWPIPNQMRPGEAAGLIVIALGVAIVLLTMLLGYWVVTR